MKLFSCRIIIVYLLYLLPACSIHKNRTIPPVNLSAKNGEILSIEGQLKISGIYPHLTTYAHGRPIGNYGFGSECGIGALAVWNNKLYMVNYAAHQPKGSEHKLYIVDRDKKMEIYQGSIGGTPAARMIHKESNQLFIGPYVIDSTGKIRVIPVKAMEGRLTAIARHLKDPKNMLYYYDMEGMLYEVNVHSLHVNKLYKNPLPGWHGKGGYTSQGKLVVANNGEHTNEPRIEWKVDTTNMIGPESNGILAEFDGDSFKVVERRQYTDVTTKNGIDAVPNDESPLWSVGWDKRSVRLKVMDKGAWTTYLLPKATYNNDPTHGWFTEWPRIRDIGNGDMMMDMHGMFYNFPNSFSASNTAGIYPMGSHLRYIPDFVAWNDEIVLATDETSIQGNPLAGQPQSNLWFGTKAQLSAWGPATGYGAIWLEDDVVANQHSLPFLVAGFDHKILHLKNSMQYPVTVTVQIDKKGDNTWTDYKVLQIDGHKYSYFIFEKDVKAEWVRLVSNASAKLTATFHLTDAQLKRTNKYEQRFNAIADVDTKESVSHAKLFSNRNNFNLSVFSGQISNGVFQKEGDFEFTKLDFKFIEGLKDSTALEALKRDDPYKEVDFANQKIADLKDTKENAAKEIWSADEASVILQAKNYKVRLPKGNPAYHSKFPASSTRFKREVESERELANICGTFYELPLQEVGKEPLYKMMRPISTHNKQISDFNTWNGLLVMSGIKNNTAASEHVFRTKDGSLALWFGGIDDIWSFGKPVGVGGPWKNNHVKANELSDMYLMTGYDKKTLHLETDKDSQISLFIHINHYLKEPVLFKTFSVKAGEKLEYEFPEGFSAHWVQVNVDIDCKATAWFVYE
ncbi:MAG: hypothetical protein EAY75_09315 [Bacteroidetes bacterium]|nr:MAG: hypothetical protein EAY75_09315 [Bacteroidota bacterium]